MISGALANILVFSCDVITLPCDGTRCQHDGTCEDFGDVQYYECSCQPGYTGVNCETNISKYGAWTIGIRFCILAWL